MFHQYENHVATNLPLQPRISDSKLVDPLSKLNLRVLGADKTFYAISHSFWPTTCWKIQKGAEGRQMDTWLQDKDRVRLQETRRPATWVRLIKRLTGSGEAISYEAWNTDKKNRTTSEPQLQLQLSSHATHLGMCGFASICDSVARGAFSRLLRICAPASWLPFASHESSANSNLNTEKLAKDGRSLDLLKGEAPHTLRKISQTNTRNLKWQSGLIQNYWVWSNADMLSVGWANSIIAKYKCPGSVRSYLDPTLWS